MERIRIFAAVFVLLHLPGAGHAQENCPEGRTAGGECVNADLAATMRQNGVIYSQPQLSQTAYPILPTEDYTYRYPHSLIPNPLSPAPPGRP